MVCIEAVVDVDDIEVVVAVGRTGVVGEIVVEVVGVVGRAGGGDVGGRGHEFGWGRDEVVGVGGMGLGVIVGGGKLLF